MGKFRSAYDATTWEIYSNNICCRDAASELFGMPADWSNELLTNNHQFVDPIQRICSLKILSGGPFLATELHRKHI